MCLNVVILRSRREVVGSNLINKAMIIEFVLLLVLIVVELWVISLLVKYNSDSYDN